MERWALTAGVAQRTLAQGRSMGTKRVPIDSDLLRRLYVHEALSTVEIAARLGCADRTILRRLRRAGIDVRPRGPVPTSRAERMGIG